jgi:hypothetical protein
MPVSIGVDLHIPPPSTVELVPDAISDNPLIATFSVQPLDEWPADFDSLTPEEQKRLKDRYRFLGIRLRGDLDYLTIPLTKETHDVP